MAKKNERKPLPPIGSIILSRYGREMRVVQHYRELHLVGLNPTDGSFRSDVPSVTWPPENCICSGEQMPWEYYDFHGAIRQHRDNYRLKLLSVLRLSLSA